jgi:hypothetical protein
MNGRVWRVVCLLRTCAEFNARAIEQLSSFCDWAICCRVSFGLRPNFTPRALAAFIPAWVRSARVSVRCER